MKLRIAIALTLVVGFFNQIQAQDVFRTELFTVDMVMKYRNEIELSEAKAEAIKSFYNERITEYNSLKWDLDAAMNDLNQLIELPKVDLEATNTQMRKVMKMEDDLKIMRLEMLISIKNELTVQQQNKLKEIRTDSDMKSSDLITPINEDPRVVLRVEGKSEKENPLFIIIDGEKETKVKSASDVNPNSIEKIEVLKGENAKEKYGEGGKNGVVIITLKKNKP
jgi:hypothetical protein